VNLQRLRQMPLSEIAGRSRQEASKWWDRVASTSARPTPSGTALDGDERLEAIRAGIARRFFAGADDDQTPAVLSERLRDAASDVMASAERGLEGRFDLLGYRGLSFGNPPDWHADPVSGKHAPLVHWSRLDPLDRTSVGDSKVVWELNRHQWLVRLAQAYRLSGDERYAEAVAAHVTGWLRANPAGHGINWASSLELSFRLVAWCWTLVLLRRSPQITPQLFGGMLASIESQAAHVEKYLSHYFSPNTHLTGEALGLFYAGTLLPDLTRARVWRERGAAILADEIGRQVRPDGVYFEQSTCYQRYTVEIYLHLFLLARRNGVALPRDVGEPIQRMLDFLLTVRRPDGTVPQLGDSDGGCLLPLADRSPDDYRGVFSIAAAVFGRPDYAWAAGGLAPETVWLLGREGADQAASVEPAPPTRRPSRLFPNGGYAVMGSGWEPSAHHLIFDVGPFGCPFSGGHGHADLLSIQCAAFGQPFLVDAGTGTYADPAWRDHFRATAAHSTVVVDGESQALPAGPFAWRQRPAVRLRRWLSTEALDFADAEHDAYGRLSDPVSHRRRVLFVKPRYFVVVDDLEGAAEHRVEVRFQFGAGDVGWGPGRWARAVAGGRGLLVCPVATVPLDARVRTGGCDPIEGWISADYGRREPAPALVYAAVARLPMRIFTLLLPCADPSANPPEPRLLACDYAGPTAIALGEGGESVACGPDGLLVHSGGSPAS